MKNRRFSFKKVLLMMVLTVGASFMLISCGTKKEPSIKEITERISSVTDISNLQKADNEKLQRFYNIDQSQLEEYELYIASNNIQSQEVAIFKVKDENQIDNVKKAIEERVANQAANFKDYLPEQYALVENNVIENNGKYLLLAISKDAEKIEEEFNNSFK